MKTELFCGDYEIMDAKTIMLFNKYSDLKINIDTERNFKFDVILKFPDDDTSKTWIKKESNAKENILTIICYNFNNLFGTSTNEPINIAHIDNKNIYMHIYVSKMENDIKYINYTLYIER